MKLTKPGLFCLPLLACAAAFTMNSASGLTAKITLPDGAVRTARLQGVGCSLSICSRTILKAKYERDPLVSTPLDTIATIRETTANDAVFTLRDGAVRRMSLVKDFRVLYLANPGGGTEKLDLAKVKAVEFLAPGK